MLHTMRSGLFSHLSDLVHDYLINKSNIVGIEIGSYAGESAELFLISGAFSKLYCIDPWMMNYDPSDPTGDSGIILAERAFDSRFSNNPIVQKIKAKSSDVVNQSQDNSIDFIYIDGCHQYDYVIEDLRNYVPKVKVGGIISGHDYGGPTTPGVTQAVDEYFNGEKPKSRYPDYSWVYINN